MLDFRQNLLLKFMFSKKATKIDEIFTVHLTLCSKCQICGEDFVNFRGLLRKYELYTTQRNSNQKLIYRDYLFFVKNYFLLVVLH